MLSRQRRYSAEEIARRGDETYDRSVLPSLRPEDQGKIVAIDIESGEWEIDESEIAACSRLESRIPDSQIWIVRVGSRYARRFGAGRSKGRKWSLVTSPLTLTQSYPCIFLARMKKSASGQPSFNGWLTLPPDLIASLGLR